MGNFFTDILAQDPRFHSRKPIRDLDLLEPVTRALVQQVLQEAASLGIALMVFETYRSHTNPFRADIEWMVSVEITTGYPDSSFHPTEAVARQAMAAFLYRFKGTPNGTHPTCLVAPYTDVPVTAPFCGEIAWMKSTGITTGYPGGTFHPGDVVQRQAMAAFLHRLSLPQ